MYSISGLMLILMMFCIIFHSGKATWVDDGDLSLRKTSFDSRLDLKHERKIRGHKRAPRPQPTPDAYREKSQKMEQKVVDVLNEMDLMLVSESLSYLLATDLLDAILAALQVLLPPEPLRKFRAGIMNDSDHFIRIIKEGVIAARDYVEEIVDLLSDPIKQEKLLSEFPAKYRAPLSHYLREDKASVYDLIDAFLVSLSIDHKVIFGADDERAKQAVLVNILNGIEKVSGGFLGATQLDDEAIESARIELLGNQELLRMIGVEENIVLNPKLFANYIKTSMQMLELELENLNLESDEELEVDLDEEFQSLLFKEQ